MLFLLCAPISFADNPSWEEIKKLEITYQVLNIVDTAQTVEFLNSGCCKELNPILGPHPSTEKVIAFKAIVGVGHYLLARELYEYNPKYAKMFQYITIGTLGTVVALNFRCTF